MESSEVIVRGQVRVRIPRSAITAVRSERDALIIEAGEDELVLDLGEVEAAKWALTLLKPPPTLAQKLGVGADRRAFVVGVVDDIRLVEALDDATVRDPGEALTLIAVLRAHADLSAALSLAQSHPTLPIWCVHGRGKSAVVTGPSVRLAFRSARYVDSKTSAVSGSWTATRYTRRG